MKRRTIVVVVVALVFGALASDALRTRAHESWTSGQRHEDIYYLPPASWLPGLSLGHEEALADLLWMRALVYFGDELVQQGASRYVLDYAEAIEALDPHFLALYRWVGMAGFYGAQGRTPEDAERAIAMMERGAERFPDDGQLAWDLGAALAFELPVIVDDEAIRDEARERAAPHLLRAVRLGAAPEWITLASAALLSRIGRTHQAIRHLEQMYPLVEDPETKRQIAERIGELRASAREQGLEAPLRELEETQRRLQLEERR